MNPVIRRTIRTLAVLMLLAIAVCSFYCYVSQIRPLISQAQAVLDTASPEDRAALTKFAPLILRAHGGSIAYPVADALGSRYDALHCPRNSLKWHACMFFQTTALGASFEQDELALLWSRLIYVGYHERGLAFAARERFSKRLDALSLDELAELVALAHAPATYMQDPVRLEKRKRWLLEGPAAGPRAPMPSSS